MGTYPHRLPHNARVRLPRACVFLDTETRRIPDRDNQRVGFEQLRLWVASSWVRNNRGWRQVKTGHGQDCASWWNWLETVLSDRWTVWLFSHNLGFDWTVLGGWDWLDGQRVVWVMGCTEDPPSWWRLRTPLGSLCAVDTLNYFGCKLTKIADVVGVRKTQVDFATVSDSELFDHCCRDVEILERTMIELLVVWQAEQLGTWALSAGGLAWNAWRHSWMDHPVWIHSNEAATLLERDSYYGGRCDCYQLGAVAGPLWHVDVNSLYPYLMHEFRHPFCLMAVEGEMHPWELLRLCEKYWCCASVRLNAGHAAYPLRKPEGVWYALGRFVTTLCGRELERALASGDVEQIFQVAVYERDFLFSRWVEDWYSDRAGHRHQDTPIRGLLAKLLLNALSGKWGQRRHRLEPRPGISCHCPYGRFSRNDKSYQAIAWVAHEIVRAPRGSVEGEWPHSFPGIAGSITAAGRVYMDQLRALAGVGHVFYQDTDSLVVDRVGLDALVAGGHCHQTALGKLKISGPYASAVFRGRKRYSLGALEVAAGERAGSRQLQNGQHTVERWQGLNSVLSGEPGRTIRVELVSWTPADGYSWGTVLPSGRIVPVEVEL